MPHFANGLTVADVDGVRFRRGGKIGDELSQRDAGFGHAEEVDGLLDGDGEDERLRIRVADVFGRRAHEAPRDVHRIFATFEHAHEPIH